jgi:hypothetical protein
MSKCVICSRTINEEGETQWKIVLDGSLFVACNKDHALEFIRGYNGYSAYNSHIRKRLCIHCKNYFESKGRKRTVCDLCLKKNFAVKAQRQKEKANLNKSKNSNSLFKERVEKIKKLKKVIDFTDN